MNNLKVALKRLMADESGQDLIEYALIAALVGLASVTALSGLATAITTEFGTISTAITGAKA
ncbi:Flp family type IVb pilin [Acidicapsa ligni]|uniref:Flp family type IVb pilin n=1 Tax=Acidicapsa ligni TaxID=542300 RepID=UPI0021E0370F|nr:Flp family type IVb pilin [Acidicapsa ligni]